LIARHFNSRRRDKFGDLADAQKKLGIAKQKLELIEKMICDNVQRDKEKAAQECRKIKMHFFDPWGTDLDTYTAVKMNKLLGGYVPPGTSMKEVEPKLTLLPNNANRIHVVLFVFPMLMIMMGEKAKELIDFMNQCTNQENGGYDPILVVTHIDDFENTEDRKELMDKIRTKFPSCTIFFHQNYTKEKERNADIDLSSRLILNCIIQKYSSWKALHRNYFDGVKWQTGTILTEEDTKPKEQQKEPQKEPQKKPQREPTGTPVSTTSSSDQQQLHCPKGHSPAEAGQGKRCDVCAELKIAARAQPNSADEPMCPKGHSKEQAGLGKRCDVCAELKVIPVKKEKADSLEPICPKGHSKEQAGPGKRCDECGGLKVIPEKKAEPLEPQCPKGHSKEQAGPGKRCDECGELKVIPEKKAEPAEPQCPKGHSKEQAGPGKRCDECGELKVNAPESRRRKEPGCPKGHPPEQAGPGKRCDVCGELKV